MGAIRRFIDRADRRAGLTATGYALLALGSFIHAAAVLAIWLRLNPFTFVAWLLLIWLAIAILTFFLCLILAIRSA